MESKIKNVLIFAVLTLLPLLNSFAQNENTKLKWFGDVRIRGEQDWDSQDKNGVMRDDRSRMRLRLRFGFTYKFSDNVLFGGRLRSGNEFATQSPHADLGNELIPKSINIDKAYIKTNWDGGSFWAGKNSYPFWKQNEFFWDDDAIPEGLAINQSVKIDDAKKLKFNAGYFILDNSISNDFSDKANFVGLQTAFNGNFDKTNLQAAVGYFNFTEDTAQVDVRLMDLDYQLLQAGANVSFPVWGNKKIKIGIDFTYNMEDYQETMANYDQKTGYVGSIKLGDLNGHGHWLIGYYFAHIEKYAVVPGYAQDDWVRWGSATVTRSSNFEGHEFRLGYAFAKKHNLVARLYLVDGIEPEEGGTELESGNRFRLDWNIGF